MKLGQYGNLFMHNEDMKVGTPGPLRGSASAPAKRPKSKKRRKHPQMLSQSTGSSAYLFMHYDDRDMGQGAYTPLRHDVNTNKYSAANNTMTSDDATVDVLTASKYQ